MERRTRKRIWESKGSRSREETREEKVEPEITAARVGDGQRPGGAPVGEGSLVGEGTGRPETSYWLPSRGICPQLIFFCPVTAK